VSHVKNALYFIVFKIISILHQYNKIYLCLYNSWNILSWVLKKDIAFVDYFGEHIGKLQTQALPWKIETANDCVYARSRHILRRPAGVARVVRADTLTGRLTRIKFFFLSLSHERGSHGVKCKFNSAMIRFGTFIHVATRARVKLASGSVREIDKHGCSDPGKETFQKFISNPYRAVLCHERVILYSCISLSLSLSSLAKGIMQAAFRGNFYFSMQLCALSLSLSPVSFR